MSHYEIYLYYLILVKLNNCYFSKFKFFKVILHQFWVKNIFPWKFNLEYGGTFTKLFMHVSSRNMFPATRNLQIRLHVYRPRHCVVETDCFDDCRSWPREEKINNHGCWGKHAHIPDNDYCGICLFHVVWTIFFAIILMWYTRNIFLFQFSFFINLTNVPVKQNPCYFRVCFDTKNIR
jgi:hypothetical protein